MPHAVQKPRLSASSFSAPLISAAASSLVPWFSIILSCAPWFSVSQPQDPAGNVIVSVTSGEGEGAMKTIFGLRQAEDLTFLTHPTVTVTVTVSFPAPLLVCVLPRCASPC
ncbi:hypothetical protein AAHE18_11G167700 [Arachis hypogaea]